MDKKTLTEMIENALCRHGLPNVEKAAKVCVDVLDKLEVVKFEQEEKKPCDQ